MKIDVIIVLHYCYKAIENVEQSFKKRSPDQNQYKFQIRVYP